MSVKLTPVETLKVGIIGLGSEGCKLVSRIELSPDWNASVALWDCCRNSLDHFEESSGATHSLGVNIAHGLGCVGQYEMGRSIFLEDQDFCREWIQDKDILLVAGALGGGFTGGFLPEFAKAVKMTNTPMLVYALLPFSFEGRKRMENSRLVLGKLRESCLSVATIEGDDFLASIDESGFAQAAVEQMKLESAGAISTMVSMLLDEGLYDFNLSTLQSAFDLDVAKTLVISSQADDESEGVDRAIEELLERIDQKLPEKELKVDRLLIGVIGGKRLAAGAVNQINRMITERFNQPGKTFFGACIHEGFQGIRIVVYLSIHLGKQFEWIDLSSEESQKTSVHKESRKTARKKPKERKKGAKRKVEEEELQVFFDTILNESNRGYFDDTPANSWNGLDLDVPTYIRRGIRVKS